MKKSKLLAVMLGAIMIPTTLAVVGCGGGPTLNLQGQGTQDNPYVIATAENLNEITKLSAQNAFLTENKFFKLTADIGNADNPYQTTAEDFNAIFKGTLLGDSKTITMAGETALFDKNEGTIQNLNIVGNVNADETEGLVGMLANTNAGTIKNANIAGQATSTRGAESDLASAETNGIGGLVGLNDTNGKIEGAYSEATIQAKVGGGGFAGVNKGEIKDAYNEGTIGMERPKTDVNAWLSNTINYSVMGGIAGINFGTILASQNKSYVFAPALNTSAEGYNSNMKGNDFIGGIAGYNKANATISECTNLYGSKSNPYIVFGDEYVGSIAGANAGTISYSVVTQHIGARAKFGGITSTNETTGIVTNCAVGANQARGNLLGTLADEAECAEVEYWFIADTAVNSVYNSGDGRGAVPTGENAYQNCVDGWKNDTTNLALGDILNAGLEAGQEKMVYVSAPGNPNPAFQPISNVVAFVTAYTGVAPEGAETVYNVSKLKLECTPKGNAPTGYTHIGWSYTPNGTQDDVIMDGQSAVSKWTLTPGQNIVVYAVYTQNPVVE